ncbi:MAG TPA: class I SAM-dependent methyltransferase [Candidatus Marinimicrobia bacterium]|nr:class I SAM-dependent methyltransferase [Candidatus Neomarinimicrobiota bacterium]HRS51469.1 class I SAM-dependent methyltransferase [Candidatus Neomarinimicrobiota bacterium]HRU92739.1 class I SAM-dependent methyltransferase [Candidatus Neomarinimicrobiota bacterium]
MKNQEAEGLLSPFIRNIRLKKAARIIKNNSIVLDIACGTGYLRHFLPQQCKYYGIDRMAPPSLHPFDGFLEFDILQSESFETIKNWLPEPRVDVVTMLAFIEHVKDPQYLMKQSLLLLKPNGLLIITTPHPIGRKLHESLAKLYLCSFSGAKEHESFLGKQELKCLLKQSGYQIISYERFLMGLNQMIVATPIE